MLLVFFSLIKSVFYYSCTVAVGVLRDYSSSEIQMVTDISLCFASICSKWFTIKIVFSSANRWCYYVENLRMFWADLISILTKCLDTCLEMEFNTIAYRIITRNLFFSDDTLNLCFVDRIHSTKLKYACLFTLCLLFWVLDILLFYQTSKTT